MAWGCGHWSAECLSHIWCDAEYLAPGHPWVTLVHWSQLTHHGMLVSFTPSSDMHQWHCLMSVSGGSNGPSTLVSHFDNDNYKRLNQLHYNPSLLKTTNAAQTDSEDSVDWNSFLPMHERTWLWLRYTQSGFTINDPLDIIMWIVCQFHENSDIELHSKPVFCLKPMSESLEQSICIVCIWIGHFSNHTSTNPLQLSMQVLQHVEYSRTSCFYLLCEEQWGTVGLQWESRGREFETNLPPTQPRAYWGANPAYLSPPAKIDYSTTLLRYPIIQNKSDQTTYYSCCYYHLSQIHHYFMIPIDILLSHESSIFQSP